MEIECKLKLNTVFNPYSLVHILNQLIYFIDSIIRIVIWKNQKSRFYAPQEFEKETRSLNNNAVEDDELNNYDESVRLSNSSYQREFLISDDEDSMSIKSDIIVERHDGSVLKTNHSYGRINNAEYISDDEDYSSTNIQSHNSIFGGCQGHHNHSLWQLFHLLIIQSRDIVSKGIMLTMWVLVNIVKGLSKWLKNFSRVDRIWKIPFYFPLVFLERLYCFCALNECRQINVPTYLSLPKRSSNCNDDSIITKCSWPMWAIGMVVVTVFIFGCYFASPNATIKQKYEIGMENMEYIFDRFLFNLYNLPGNDCMTKDNCCSSQSVTVKRWIVCFLSLPYRVIFFGMKVESMDMTVIDESLQNLTDWRLRRKIYQIKTLLDDLRRKARLVSKKSVQSDQLYFTLKGVAEYNLTDALILTSKQEEIELVYDDSLKRYEQIYVNLNIMSDLKQVFEKTATDSKSCAKCTSRKMVSELEYSIGDEIKVIGKLGSRVKSVERDIQRKIGYNPVSKEFDAIRKDMTNIEKSVMKWRTQLSKFDSFKMKFRSEVGLLKNYVNDLTASEMNRHTKGNNELLTRIDQLLANLHRKMKQFLSQQKETISQHIEKKFIFNGQTIFNEIMMDFCPKIQEFVKMTIVSAVTMSNSIKACGFFGTSSLGIDTHSLCSSQLNSCFNKSVILNIMKNALETFAADSIGDFDYALKTNGGQIIESHSTTSLYIEMFEDNYEVSESNWPFLNLMMSNPQTLVNTINFLNSADNGPGRCWQFKGNKGSTVIELASVINVTRITIDHIYPEIALSKTVYDALKDFHIIALKNADDLNGILMGAFVFENPKKYPIQQFQIMNPSPTQYIKFAVNSNHGADSTCIYRIRIHGRPVDQ